MRSRKWLLRWIRSLDGLYLFKPNGLELKISVIPFKAQEARENLKGQRQRKIRSSGEGPSNSWQPSWLLFLSLLGGSDDAEGPTRGLRMMMKVCVKDRSFENFVFATMFD
ncbi:hypothetical protein Ancab_027796 [Ancistrocladus abbreviatus]